LILGTQISSFGRSQIARSTIEAYLATEYRISGEWSLILRIGKLSADLAVLCKRFAAEGASIITAWNPHSEPKSHDENVAAQQRLVAELDRRSLRHQPGHGADPMGTWPPEDSRLILGIDLIVAAALGTEFQQNGIVWIGSDAIPTLVLLR
jgi:hypothetical protein